MAKLIHKDDRRRQAVAEFGAFVRKYKVEIVDSYDDDDDHEGYWIMFGDGMTDPIRIIFDDPGKMLYLDNGVFHEPPDDE